MPQTLTTLLREQSLNGCGSVNTMGDLPPAYPSGPVMAPYYGTSALGAFPSLSLVPKWVWYAAGGLALYYIARK